MRDFGSVGPEFWTRGSGKRLRGNNAAQLVGLFLLTAPESNMLGLYHVPFVSICHYLGMSADDTRAALAACGKAQLAQYDEDAELVWLPNTAEKRIGLELKEGDKKRAWVAKEIKALGSHRFVRQFLTRYGVAYGLVATTPPPSSPQILDAPSTPQDAPSGILEGSSTVQGEYSTGSDPESEPSPAPVAPANDAPPRASGAFGMAADSWCDGVRSVTGGRPTLKPWERTAIEDIALDRDPGANPTAWAHAEGAAFAKRQKASKPPLLVTAERYLEWVGSGRLAPFERAANGKFTPMEPTRQAYYEPLPKQKAPKGGAVPAPANFQAALDKLGTDE